jgi:hypothetical protein
VTVALVGVMFLRLEILKVGLHISRALVAPLSTTHGWIYNAILRQIKRINELPMVYFTRGDNMITLNQAALYVRENEQTSRLKVIHVHEMDREIPANLAEHLRVIDHLYPDLRINFVAVTGTFGPTLVEGLSRRLGIPKNCMFIGTPDRRPRWSPKKMGRSKMENPQALIVSAPSCAIVRAGLCTTALLILAMATACGTDRPDYEEWSRAWAKRR